jgi:hypothetical protein
MRVGKSLVGAAGFEPATTGLEGRCSIQLSYAPVRVSPASRLYRAAIVGQALSPVHSAGKRAFPNAQRRGSNITTRIPRHPRQESFLRENVRLALQFPRPLHPCVMLQVLDNPQLLVRHHHLLCLQRQRLLRQPRLLFEAKYPSPAPVHIRSPRPESSAARRPAMQPNPPEARHGWQPSRPGSRSCAPLSAPRAPAPAATAYRATAAPGRGGNGAPSPRYTISASASRRFEVSSPGETSVGFCRRNLMISSRERIAVSSLLFDPDTYAPRLIRSSDCL